MRRRRTGRRLHDPAWRDRDFSRGRPASGNRPTRGNGDYRRRQGRDEPAARPAKPRGGATKRPVRILLPTSRSPSRHRRHQPQIQIPIASECGPRVPSSGTFVRLPAPETLHGRRPSAAGSDDAESGRSKHRDGDLEGLLVDPACHGANEHSECMTSLSVNRPQAHVHSRHRTCECHPACVPASD